MRHINYLLVLTLLPGLLFSQKKGILTGQIIDSETGDQLIGASVIEPESGAGTTADVRGNYRLELEPGLYDIRYSFIGFQSKVINDVEIKSGEISKMDVLLSVSTNELAEVTVSASSIKNNEVALLQLQQKSISVQDGVSFEEIRRNGFTNSAESMKQVTGATIEDGKFIVMRGLADRYSISLLEGVLLPTTNPYKNSASLDLIPSAMLDNIIVKKTFTPDLPGSFTGGAVDVTTKSIPDKFYINIRGALGYNDQTTFNPGFLRDNVSGSTDWLGRDDGSRGLHQNFVDSDFLVNRGQYVRDYRNERLSDADVEEFNAVNRQLTERGFHVQSAPAPLNHRLSFLTGDRIKTGTESSWGYNFGVNYNRSFTQFDDRQRNSYTARIPDGSESRMQPFLLSSGLESREEVSNGAIATLAYQINPSNVISLFSIYNNATDFSVIDMTDGFYPGALSFGRYRNRVISTVQRQLWNNQLRAVHHAGPLMVEWSANYIRSSQNEPDIRFLGLPQDNEGDYFYVREVQRPFHFFRDLQDIQYNAKLDVSYDLSDRLELKAGGFFTRKTRSFEEIRFQLEDNQTDGSHEEYLDITESDGDFAAYFSPENTGLLGYASDGRAIIGNTFVDQSRPENVYDGYEQVSAAYAMAVFDVATRWKLVGGVRMEATDILVETRDQSQRGSIEVVDLLPSLNAIFALTERSNWRLSLTQTVARPNMRELAPFASFDLLGSFPIVGNPDITRTNITNIDLRYELFPTPGELFAVSGFYKRFENPIVLELDVATDQPQYQYVNTNTGNLVGVELEWRKKLDFISEALRDFKFSANFTYIHSVVDLSEEEFSTRRKLDDQIEPYRPFAFQSPYILNLMLAYTHRESGWAANLYANAFGPRLAANGSGAAPDEYQVYSRLNDQGEMENDIPVPELNIRIQKSINERLNMAFSINNILDYSVVQYQEDKGRYFTTGAFNPGRTFSLSFNYTID